MKSILMIKADSPEVEVILSDGTEILTEKKWLAGRELSTQLLSVINELCDSAGLLLIDLTGIVVYEGPGSYTGLRISTSVANAIGYSLNIRIAGSSGTNWQPKGVQKLHITEEFKPVAPVYGGAVFTTKPKK